MSLFSTTAFLFFFTAALTTSLPEGIIHTDDTCTQIHMDSELDKRIPIEKLDFISKTESNDLYVVIFLGTDCPISQKYIHTLRQMNDEYKEQVSFFGLFPKAFTESQIENFKKEYNIPFDLVSDTDNYYAHLLKATITPEAYFFNKAGEVFYDGAIDNWFFALGRNRLKPNEHYLKDAILSVLNGEVILKPHADAVGCLIEMKH